MLRKVHGAIRRINRSIEVLFCPRRNFIYPAEIYSHHRVSFSQEGEDLVLLELLKNKQTGFYVDIGAYHPQRFSNTYLFYLMGWHGINIDAMPGSMQLFNKLRPRDINLENPISNTQENLVYFIFHEAALNTFSQPLALKRHREHNYRLRDKTFLKTVTLASVLDRCLPDGQVIDFLNIDVEGWDYQVLLSNDWEKYRPKFLLVEDLRTSLTPVIEPSAIQEFLSKQGYQLVARTSRTLFFHMNS